MARDHVPGAKRQIARSRGALSGVALMVLGAWGALIPFVGPYFNFSYTPDKAWHWDAARGWLEVLPGAAAFVAGFLLLTSSSRMVTLVASWIGIAAGAWFVIGLQLANEWHIGSPGRPANTGSGIRILETLAMFTLLGVAIVYFASTAFGRLSVVSLRDTHAAERREARLERDNAEAAAAAEAARTREPAGRRDRDDVRDDRMDDDARRPGAYDDRDQDRKRDVVDERPRRGDDLGDDRPGRGSDVADDRGFQGGRHEQPVGDARTDGGQYSEQDARTGQQDGGQFAPQAGGQHAQPTQAAAPTATTPDAPPKRHFWQR